MTRGYEEQERANGELLEDFQRWLTEVKGLKRKTVNDHVANIEFFINGPLLHEPFKAPEDGISQIDSFMSSYFPRKALWHSEAAVRKMGASLKKFYIFLHELGRVDDEDLAEVKDLVKQGMQYWI